MDPGKSASLSGRFRQPLEGIHPVQAGYALGNLFFFGLEDMPELPVVPFHEFLGADNPRIGKIPGPVPEPVHPAQLETPAAFLFQDLFIDPASFFRFLYTLFI
jgi:hypothetical protein